MKGKRFEINKHKLYQKYVTFRMSLAEIAEEEGVHPSTISRKLANYNIPTRTISEAMTGRELSPETKAKISSSRRKKNPSDSE